MTLYLHRTVFNSTYETSSHCIVPRLTGKELEGCEYETPFGGEEAHLLPGLHVTSTAGTGLVLTNICVFRFVEI